MASRNAAAGKDNDHLLDAETQSLSSLCVEPPLSVNDNLDDRMDDLSLDDDEEVMDEMRVETLEEELGGGGGFGGDDDDVSVAFSSNLPDCQNEKNGGEGGFAAKANDTGEDALLDEIDQVGPENFVCKTESLSDCK